MQVDQLPGRVVRGFGTELEIDDYTGAFSGYLALESGEFVQVEFVEQETSFGPDGTSFEPEMELSLVGDPGGEFWELTGTIAAAEPVREKITAFDQGEQVWEWTRTAGLLLTLGGGQTLSFHCASPRSPEVVMRVDQALPPIEKGVYQQHHTRTYTYERL